MKKLTFQNILLILIAIGIWMSVLQKLGVIRVAEKVDADVSGSVDVDNTVDVNVVQ